MTRTPLHYRIDPIVLGDGRAGRVLFEVRELFFEQLRVHELYAAELQVHPADLRALDLVSRNWREPLTMGRLAALLHLSTGAVTGTVDRLEQSNLVERVRDENDRRRVLLRVTDEADRLTRAFYSGYVKRLRDVLDAFDDEELDACERVLGALALSLAED